MKKLLILGKSTMAGHVIKKFFKEKKEYSVVSVDENKVFDKHGLNSEVFYEDYDCIINCIRCLVEESRINPTKAILYNAYLPNFLADFFLTKKTKIIQLSTDCVFSGKKGQYREADKPDGHSVYSKTKTLGESVNDKDILIRSSYIGPNLEGFDEEIFDWFLSQKNDVFGYLNSFWNGITTLELSKSIYELIEKNFSGIYHLTGDKVISKYDLLLLIKQIWNLKKIKLKKLNNDKIDRSLTDTRNLIKQKSYFDMFSELKIYMDNNKNDYKKYY